MCSEAFEELRYIKGTTRVAAALEHLRDNVLTVGNRPEAPDFIVVITDGRSSDEPAPIAQQLRDQVRPISAKLSHPDNQGAQIYALGITNLVDKEQLRDIAGDQIVVLDRFDSLEADTILQLVGSSVCRTVPIREFWAWTFL